MESSQLSPQSLYTSVQVNRCLSVVAWAVLYYDYALTFSTEYDQFWKYQSKVTPVNILFALNRYLSLLGEIPIIFYEFGTFDTKGSYADQSSLTTQINKYKSCHLLQLYHQSFAAATQGLVAALLVIRIYAFYGRGKVILSFMITLFLMGCVTGIWSVTASHTSVHIGASGSGVLMGCELPLTDQQADYLIAPWCTMLLFDTTVFFLTLRKSLKVIRLPGGSSTIFQVMLRDGTIYFGALVMVNIANILTFLIAPPAERGMPTTLTNVMSSTLISRLVLNLRDPNLSKLPQHNSRRQVDWTENSVPMTSIGFEPRTTTDTSTSTHSDDF